MSGPRDVVAAARGVVVELGGVPVVHGVDLEVRAGEVLALLGPNGAGKSTLLGTLAGDHRPAAGDVELAGRPVDRWSVRDLARHRAVLPQHTAVSFPFTVAEVVAMGRAPWAGTPQEVDDDAAVAEALEACDVTHLADRTVPTLSGGERARVGLARVLAQRVGLLLLDEPTAALDLHHQEMVMARARTHADAGGAVVVVLHDLTLAGAWADRLCLLSRGTVAAAGEPADVLTPEGLSAVYGCAVDVVPHPRTGHLIVVPDRAPR